MTTGENKKSVVVRTNEITPTSKGIVPSTFEELIQISKLIKSAPKFLPKGKTTYSVEELAVNIQTGLEIGLTVMQAIQGIMLVNGAASVWGDYMIGLVLASGKLKKISEWSQGSFEKKDYAARCRVQRYGIESSTERSFSINDAVKAGLWNKNEIWKRYPKRMLHMRARSWALRDMFGDVLKGLVAVEEAVDYNKKDEQVIISGIEATGYKELANGNGEKFGENGETKTSELSGRESLVVDAPTKCDDCSCGEIQDQEHGHVDDSTDGSARQIVLDLINEKLMGLYREGNGAEELAEILEVTGSQVTRCGDMREALNHNYDSYVASFCKRAGGIGEKAIHTRAKTNFATFWSTFYGWISEQHQLKQKVDNTEQLSLDSLVYDI